jgi:hypothetical protein
MRRGVDAHLRFAGHRPGRRVAACLIGSVALVAATTGSAAAIPPTLTPGASAYSAAASTGTAALNASLQLTGSLGGLLGSLVDPIISTDLEPLANALQGGLNSQVASALGASSSLNASTDPSQSQVSTAPATFPNDTLPSPCVSTGSQPCYSATSSATNGAPLASVGLGLLNGYVEQVQSSADATNPIFGRATASSPQVSVLPGITSLIPGLPTAVNPLVSASVVSAKANCPNDGAVGAKKPATSPSINETVSSVNLLGGLVTFNVLDGQLTSLKVNGTSYQINGLPGSGIPELGTITVAGVTIAPYGNSVIVSFPLTVSQVLAGLGLPTTVINALTGFTPTSSVTMSLIVGPNATVTSTSASAWGLGIGVNLSGDLGFNILNLVTANVHIPTGIRSGNLGNLLDLRLAYVACQSGVNLSGSVTKAVPPALV